MTAGLVYAALDVILTKLFLMVWNVTKDNIRVRMAVTEERTWAPPLAAPPALPNMADREEYSKRTGIPVETIGSSEFTAGRTWCVEDVIRSVYKEFDMPYPEKK